MSRLNSFGRMILAVIALGMIAGCTPLQISKPNVWPFVTEDPPGTPSRIVASWTDTVLYQPNQTPMRGFGGRFLFYSGDKPESIKVDGTLTVYAFDETNRDPNNVRPDRKYVFTKEQLPKHYSKSKLGHSYSVWIPWDETGGPQKEISMIARFTPERGGVVVGEQTKHLLPGKMQIVVKNSNGDSSPPAAPPAIPAQYPSTSNGSVQAASYVLPLPPVDAKMPITEQSGMNLSRQMNVTTIKLPPQSSLKNLSVIGERANPATRTAESASPGIGSNSVTRSAEINATVAGMGENPPAREQMKLVTAGFHPSNPESRPFSPSNRFAPDRSPAPCEPISQPNRDRGPWQPSPSGQAYFPETTSQSTTGIVCPPSAVNAGITQY